MVRLLYGPVTIATPTADDGDFGPVAVSMSVYRTRTTNTAETSLLSEVGSPITSVTPNATTGVATWQGPDGYTGALWLLDPNTGVRWEVQPNGVAERSTSAPVTSVTLDGGTPQTGDVALTSPTAPTWSTLGGKPLVIGAGTTAALARAAILATSIADVNTAVTAALATAPGFVTYNEGDPIPSVPQGSLLVMIPAGAGAPTFTVLSAAAGATDGTTFTTGSNDAANVPTVLFAHVTSGRTDGATTAPPFPSSITGMGLTWSSVAVMRTSVNAGAGGNLAAAVYMAIGTPTDGALTITFGTTAMNCLWRVVQATGLATTGTVVQSQPVQTTSPTPSATFASAVNAANPVIGFYAQNSAGQVMAQGNGFTPLGDQIPATDGPTILSDAEYRLDGTNTVGWAGGSTATAQKIIIALELKSA